MQYLAARTVAVRRHRARVQRRSHQLPHRRLFPQDRLWRQHRVRAAYNARPVQLVVAVLLVANFTVSAVEAQLRPSPSTPTATCFFASEVFFAIAFAVELLWNLYGHFFLYFWLGPDGWWNAFDAVVVAVSVLSLGLRGAPGLSVLRLLRACRAFRLFKRVTSLRCITEGVLASLPGVANAFAVLLVLMGVWAVMGVEFFADRLPQEFGTFFKALFTLWQVLTMDSWASKIARELIFDFGLPLASVYFVLFTFAAGIVLTNVVVSVLLERYLDKTKQLTARAARTSLGRAIHPSLLARTDTIEAIRLVLDARRLRALDTLEVHQLVELLLGGRDCPSPQMKGVQEALARAMLTGGHARRARLSLVEFVDAQLHDAG